VVNFFSSGGAGYVHGKQGKVMKLNLGCGAQVPDGWLNVDYSLGARFMKIPFFRAFNRKMKLFKLDWNKKIYIHDLTKKFPWGESSVDIVYSSHTLEHFPKETGRFFLEECHRVLRQNGIIRIVVPDLRYEVLEYTEGRINADDFLKNLFVLSGRSKNKFKAFLSPFFEFPHKCMYDNARLIEILNEIGFETSTRLAFDSNIEEIEQVELEDRTENAVIVEGRKR
jgi:predicted SAM-dependent methyltransferase